MVDSADYGALTKIGESENTEVQIRRQAVKEENFKGFGCIFSVSLFMILRYPE
jgi:hypothetical protein